MREREQVSAVCAECGAPVSFARGAMQVNCGYCNAGMVVQQEALLVRLACPACAGNFYYLDGTMAGACPYCETPLLALTRQRLLRYVIVADEARSERPEGSELVYAPFWRLSALLYGWDIGKRQRVSEGAELRGADEVDAVATRRIVDDAPLKAFSGRVVDRHLPDPATLALGIVSLRLRGAVYPIEPFRQQHETLGRVVAPTLDYEVVRDRLYQSAIELGYASESMRLECQRADIVAETVSLLYYPFWVRGSGRGMAVWDAVNGEPEQLQVATDAPSGEAFTAFDELQLLELRCGGCQAPLPLGNHAVVYPCHRCNTFWVAERDGLRAFEARYARPVQATEPGEKLIWLPFWRVDTELNYCDQVARTAGELRSMLKIRPLPAAEGAGAGTAALSYYAPAYGALRAPRLDHAARDLTRLQPELSTGDYAGGEVFSCFFAPEDAHRLGYAMWIQLLPGALAKRLRSLRVRSGSTQLWYVPFAEQGRELRSLISGRRYERSAFRGVGH